MCNKQHDTSRSGNADWSFKKTQLFFPWDSSRPSCCSHLDTNIFSLQFWEILSAPELCFHVSGGVSLAVMPATTDSPDYLQAHKLPRTDTWFCIYSWSWRGEHYGYFWPFILMALPERLESENSQLITKSKMLTQAEPEDLKTTSELGSNRLL